MFYAAGMVCIAVIVQVAQIVRGVFKFDECRIRLNFLFPRDKIKDITIFTGWSLFGGTGVMLRDQGSSVLLNMYFGPIANAAYGISQQVTNAANMLANSLTGALAPEVTTREGGGRRGGMMSLAMRANIIGTALIVMFAVPLILEMDDVLSLWLINPPVYASTLCRCMLTMWILDRMTMGYMLAVNAGGRILGYQLTIGVVLLLTLPMAWLLLDMGYSPAAVGISLIITIIMVSVSRIVWMKILFKTSLKEWMVDVVAPSGILALITVCVTLLARIILGTQHVYAIYVVTIAVFTASITVWMLVLNKDERSKLISIVEMRFKRAKT